MISCVVRRIESKLAIKKLFFLRNHRKKTDYGEASSTTNKSGLLMGNSFSTTPHHRKKRTYENIKSEASPQCFHTSFQYAQFAFKKLSCISCILCLLFTDQSSHSSGYLRSFFVEFCDQNGTDCGFPNEVNRSLNLRFHGSFFELACFQITFCISQ